MDSHNKKMDRVGITGVGGGVGQSIIKSLQDSSYYLIGLDGEILATGLYAVNKGFLIPYASENNYIETLLEICNKNKIRILFPGLDAELWKLSQNKLLFENIGTTVIISNEDVIRLSEDKLYTYQRLSSLGFNVPLTIIPAEYSGENVGIQFPFIVKPRFGGTGSKNVFLIKNQEEYKELFSKPANREIEFVIQEYIEGEEYTCGTVTLGGTCYGAIIMKRELRCGDTYKCHSITNQEISEYLIRLMNTIKPVGACNVQFRLKDGTPYIFEINARCSGTTAARTLCGFNEPLSITQYYIDNKLPKFTIKELTILRYWKELVCENNLVEEIRSNKEISFSFSNKI
jgi:carbamoyl-phosphate synthase large subunit